MDEDVEQLLMVMRDAQLEGNDAALAQLGAQLAERLGVSERAATATDCGLCSR